MTIPSKTSLTYILTMNAQLAADKVEGLALVGGKGTNLARLTRAGFPVPGGFFITTRAYRNFILANVLDESIQKVLREESLHDPQGLEQAAARIRRMFREGHYPAGFAEELLEAYHRLDPQQLGGLVPVAVRSSATAEDLPDMSFAGQQDTYLNILGDQALLEAVRNCWSSLWTARAIGYRERNHVSHEQAALAVVVQKMVESEAAGVLFTANPLSGLRSETVIDATYGLGEALVSGQVEPDHYVVDQGEEKITTRRLGAKAVAIHGLPGGGTVVEQEQHGQQQALPDEQILALAQLGKAVAEQYGGPQDIEWAWAGGRLYLLQSRAVTSLFPTPENMPPDPLQVLFSFGAVQGLLDPITPIGRDVLREMFVFGASLFGLKKTRSTQRVLLAAGERLWVNITTPMRNTVGRKILSGALSLVEPSVNQALGVIWDDPRLQPQRKGFRPQAMREIATFLLPMGFNLFLNILYPAKRRRQIVDNSEQVLLEMRDFCANHIQGDVYARLGQQVDLLSIFFSGYFRKTMLLFVSGVAAGMASLNILRVLNQKLPEAAQSGGKSDKENAWPELVLEITRGLPNNPTTEMDLALWNIARTILHNPQMKVMFLEQESAALVKQYQAGTLPETAQHMIGDFLDRYGGRGLAEIDLGRERWLENPGHIFEMLSGYLQITDGPQAPDVVFTNSAQVAEAAVQRLASELRKTRFGWFKAHLARFFARRVRALLGIRESPKFFAVRMMGLLRQEFHKTGKELVTAGIIDQEDDLFFLDFDELKALSRREPGNWRALVAQHRADYQREQMRRQVPRLLLSDGRAFYEGMRAPQGSLNGLHGSPVSPGSVEGNVRVVLDPRQANLQPGEILVCPGTDPSWTPLFLTAGGLVMEVGGMMTHGAVVAREYGIPAVVGVDQATQRLKTGQRIRVDGSSGVIEVVE